MDPPSLLRFDWERHLRFLEMIVDSLPLEYETQEINHLTLAYFAISGLNLLNALDQAQSNQISSWVLSFQVHPKTETDLESGEFYGFCGSRSSQFSSNFSEVSNKNCSHLASTYCALAILKMVGYNLSNINRDAILKSMRKLQQHDGRLLKDNSMQEALANAESRKDYIGFVPIHFRAETDLRFVYCAAAICSMLDNWTGMDKEKVKEYIVRCQSYDGGFGLVPGSESHGGATFCAVAALQLMGFIGEDISPNQEVIDMPLLVEWLLQRQSGDGGFQGRINKPSDTCYAFWVGGVLKMLGLFEFINKDALRNFILACQSKYGGLTKFPGMKFADLYHSYYSLSALSLLGEPGFRSLCVELGICSDSH